MALVARRSGRRRRALSEINVVPYVDVMLVLVVILMVAAPFVNPSLVELPSVGRAGQQKGEPVRVVVRADGRVSVLDAGKREQTVSIPELITAVRQRQAGNAQTPVVIEGDRNVKYEAILKVMSALQSEGIERVGLLVELDRK